MKRVIVSSKKMCIVPIKGSENLSKSFISGIDVGNFFWVVTKYSAVQLVLKSAPMWKKVDSAIPRSKLNITVNGSCERKKMKLNWDQENYWHITWNIPMSKCHGLYQNTKIHNENQSRNSQDVWVIWSSLWPKSVFQKNHRWLFMI